MIVKGAPGPPPRYHVRMSSDPFWERPEIVERFAVRPPDRRVLERLRALPVPSRLRVLDLGCAAGRNTEPLARAGCDVHALDASEAMVRRTRARLAPLLGPAEAERRVRTGRLDDLGEFPDGRFDLVLALGILDHAGSMAEWDRALAETSRVLAPGGEVEVSDFAPDARIEGRGAKPVRGEDHVFLVPEEGRRVLLDVAAHDRAFAAHGLRPVGRTGIVVRDAEHGRHVTVRGTYRKD